MAIVIFLQPLIDQGAEVNSVDAQDHATPLMFAAQNGNPAMVELLLAKKADPNRVTTTGWSALGIVEALQARNALEPAVGKGEGCGLIWARLRPGHEQVASRLRAAKAVALPRAKTPALAPGEPWTQASWDQHGKAAYARFCVQFQADCEPFFELLAKAKAKAGGRPLDLQDINQLFAHSFQPDAPVAKIFL